MPLNLLQILVIFFGRNRFMRFISLLKLGLNCDLYRKPLYNLLIDGKSKLFGNFKSDGQTIFYRNIKVSGVGPTIDSEGDGISVGEWNSVMTFKYFML